MTELAHPADRKVYDLTNRYRSGAAASMLTGVQAIARMLVEQRELDRRRGLHTATFVSGYQGSPLGGVDRMLADMPDVLDEHDITFLPGFNEELAATAVWGSQSELPLGTSTHDGVVGVWYGKGPGVDRATDALRHANLYGCHPRGGILLLVGDDPASKSSTVPAVSERSLAALGIPVLFPRNASEIVTLGLHGIEMSRASGCVVALKIVADVADGSWVVDDGVSTLSPVAPTTVWDGKDYVYQQRTMTVAAEEIMAAESDLYGPRHAVLSTYASANGLNVIEVEPEHPRWGVLAAGSAFDSMRQAFVDLRVSDDDLRQAGVRIMRMGLMSPVVAESVAAFADGLEELLVVEDKTSFVETHVRELLYGRPDAPRVIGKRDSHGAPLIPYWGELTAGRLLAPLRHVFNSRLSIKVARRPVIHLPLLETARTPYFCSGCPHNRSTAIPEGSMGGGGIGCHTLVAISDRQDSAVTGLTQMGGEGAQWIGQAAFTDAPHIFQNVGDGTYFHSGQLAIQACVAAGVNITYKILFNDVVAMTGAQDAEGALSVEKLTHKLASEGVQKIIVCADEPNRHRRRAMAAGTVLWHRDRLDDAQQILRDTAGVTVLIYDQHCAADARRQRKRGKLPSRNVRVVINEAVCEGCGDCGIKSNCLSVQPVETDFGRKTKIDQTSCNTDYTCLDGDCPSFVTVEIDPQEKLQRRSSPEPPIVDTPGGSSLTGTQDVFMAGIGGTGIVTVNQVLATAALRAGFEVEGLDQIGLSQKAGPVTAHLRFARQKLDPSNRLTPGSADCIIAFDLLTMAAEKNLAYGDRDHTVCVASTSQTPTGAMVYDPSVPYPAQDTLLARLDSVVASTVAFDVLKASERLFGNTTTANFLLVGAAFQTGALRIPAVFIEEAIHINGVQANANIAAFRWGRAAVAEPDLFAAATADPLAEVQPTQQVPALTRSLVDGETRRILEDRAQRLVGFQSVRLAEEYVRSVEQVWARERACTDDTELSESVARYLFKVMAYKDEYEVARLLTATSFIEEVGRQVPGGRRLTFKLHPPALRALGRSSKVSFRPRSHVVLRALAQLKFLRGTPLDVFGFSQVRRLERRIAQHYRTIVGEVAESLTTESYGRAVEIAQMPDVIRGYEEIKLRNVETYRRALERHGVDVSSIES